MGIINNRDKNELVSNSESKFNNSYNQLFVTLSPKDILFKGYYNRVIKKS